MVHTEHLLPPTEVTELQVTYSHDEILDQSILPTVEIEYLDPYQLVHPAAGHAYDGLVSYLNSLQTDRSNDELRSHQSVLRWFDFYTGGGFYLQPKSAVVAADDAIDAFGRKDIEYATAIMKSGVEDKLAETGDYHRLLQLNLATAEMGVLPITTCEAVYKIASSLQDRKFLPKASAEKMKFCALRLLVRNNEAAFACKVAGVTSLEDLPDDTYYILASEFARSGLYLPKKAANAFVHMKRHIADKFIFAEPVPGLFTTYKNSRGKEGARPTATALSVLVNLAAGGDLDAAGIITSGAISEKYGGSYGQYQMQDLRDLALIDDRFAAVYYKQAKQSRKLPVAIRDFAGNPAKLKLLKPEITDMQNGTLDVEVAIPLAATLTVSLIGNESPQEILQLLEPDMVTVTRISAKTEMTTLALQNLVHADRTYSLADKILVTDGASQNIAEIYQTIIGTKDPQAKFLLIQHAYKLAYDTTQVIPEFRRTAREQLMLLAEELQTVSHTLLSPPRKPLQTIGPVDIATLHYNARISPGVKLYGHFFQNFRDSLETMPENSDEIEELAIAAQLFCLLRRDAAGIILPESLEDIRYAMQISKRAVERKIESLQAGSAWNGLTPAAQAALNNLVQVFDEIAGPEIKKEVTTYLLPPISRKWRLDKLWAIESIRYSQG